MQKKSVVILLVIAFQFLLIGCKSTPQKVQEFVNSYNSSSSLFRNEIITYTKAEAFFEENKIEITYLTNLDSNGKNNGIYAKTFEKIFLEMLQKEASSRELLEEGVSFKMFFLANDYVVISDLVVDKNTINEQSKQKTVNSEKEFVSSNSNIDSSVKSMLELLNENMPIKNDDGSKLVRVDLTENNELVYKVEVPKEFGEILKAEGANDLLKESILRANNFKRISNIVRRYNITSIKYDYIDAKGKVLESVVLNQKDLR
ncbi:hypothetical protein [Flavobacterium limnophilum]|uniref:hypothetical protein n=1 Tax=Flavobacterium limnophilum TaxID=3003262 RepID=UPI0024826E0A|nr:hypothetical protein [Flavobacterium limnophilum]